MKHYLLLALLLLAAAGFYVAGLIASCFALMGVGVLLELSFWRGLLTRHPRAG